jgi:hypothetical protein
MLTDSFYISFYFLTLKFGWSDAPLCLFGQNFEIEVPTSHVWTVPYTLLTPSSKSPLMDFIFVHFVYRAKLTESGRFCQNPMIALTFVSTYTYY